MAVISGRLKTQRRRAMVPHASPVYPCSPPSPFRSFWVRTINDATTESPAALAQGKRFTLGG
ncbi:MAG: hypothetical protein U0401_27710 [Anaerolineae bacterium]